MDIIKDRQYTAPTDSTARRSAQTAIYHIVQALVRWLAPILSFTAEEIWQYIPGKDEESVFLTAWYTDLAELANNANMNEHYWEKILAIRTAVNKELENQRAAGAIGSPLEANVRLFAEPALKAQLDLLEDELRFVLITSGGTVELANSHTNDLVTTDIAGLWLQVQPLTWQKCERCWHRLEDVGKHANHVTLCERCISNIEGPGEVRKYA